MVGAVGQGRARGERDYERGRTVEDRLETESDEL